MSILIFKNVKKEATHFYYFLEAYQSSWAILNAIFEGNSSSVISESRNYLGKGKSNVEGQRGSSRKGFESIARHTTLIYVLSDMYKVKLTTCISVNQCLRHNLGYKQKIIQFIRSNQVYFSSSNVSTDTTVIVKD